MNRRIEGQRREEVILCVANRVTLCGENRGAPGLCVRYMEEVHCVSDCTDKLRKATHCQATSRSTDSNKFRSRARRAIMQRDMQSSARVRGAKSQRSKG